MITWIASKSLPKKRWTSERLVLQIGRRLLFVDLFENFRKACMENYKLDPCYYFTLLGLSWNAMLKMTKMELQPMSDINTFQFIEKGMRRGISSIMHWYGKTNKLMQGYVEELVTKYIMYLDANNLYRWTMIQYLPTGSFKWLTEDETRRLDLSKYHEDSEEGLILEVDLEYPQELHDLHNEYSCMH